MRTRVPRRRQPRSGHAQSDPQGRAGCGADRSRPSSLSHDDRDLAVAVGLPRARLREERPQVAALVDDHDAVAVGERLPGRRPPGSRSARSGRASPGRRARSGRRSAMRPRSSGIRHSSQSAVPSVAKRSMLGSRVASRTAATCSSGHSCSNQLAGRASATTSATASPARLATEIARLTRREDGSARVRRPSSATGRIAAHASGEPDHAAHRLHGADERHAEHEQLEHRQPPAAAADRDETDRHHREHPEQRRRPARLRPLPLAQDVGEGRVDEHQVVVGDEVPPVRRGEDAERRERRGARRGTAAARRGHGRASRRRGARSALRRARPSRAGSPRATSSGTTSSVRRRTPFR